MRARFYLTFDRDHISSLYVIGFSLVCLFLEIVLLSRHHRGIRDP